MFRLMAGNLVLHERIETTEAKAKELRRIVERLITRAAHLGDDLQVDVTKLDDEKASKVRSKHVHARRQVRGFLPPKLARTLPDGGVEEVDIVKKLFDEITPRYMERIKAGKGGGYTRVIKLVPRRGDNAPMAILELVGSEDAAAEAEAD